MFERPVLHSFTPLSLAGTIAITYTLPRPAGHPTGTGTQLTASTSIAKAYTPIK